MERFKLKLSYFSLHAISAAIAQPDFMWRMVISGSSIIVAIISVVSFISYTWASNSAPAVITGAPKSDTITRDDIRFVLESYIAKEVQFRNLQNTQPVAPRLGSGFGADVDVSDIPAGVDEVVVEVDSAFLDGPQP